jgi:hypothetical protein
MSQDKNGKCLIRLLYSEFLMIQAKIPTSESSATAECLRRCPSQPKSFARAARNEPTDVAIPNSARPKFET